MYWHSSKPEIKVMATNALVRKQPEPNPNQRLRHQQATKTVSHPHKDGWVGAAFQALKRNAAPPA
jgi:hypothetical protein